VTGLVGAVAQRDVTPLLMQGLHRLACRHHDSSGIALLHGPEGRLDWRRCAGPVSALERRLAGLSLAHAGIAHTRQATRGPASERNAHPQVSHGTLAVAHNGDVTNYRVTRAMLEAKGYGFESDTDTEVIAHLIHDFHKKRRGLLHAVRQATAALDGRYAIAVVAAAEPDCLVVARHGSPLVIGLSDDGHWAASDVAALPAGTRRCIFLADGDVAELRRHEVSIVDRHGCDVVRTVRPALPPEPGAARAL
jgi:glutamine---fructose-6-phosphate transaminase (isomerizing)